jgi:hypothetical protein
VAAADPATVRARHWLCGCLAGGVEDHACSKEGCREPVRACAALWLPRAICLTLADDQGTARYCDLVLGAGWTEVVALAAAYVIAVTATPAGISGAVLLLPFQVSVLGTPSPAVTPTNLLYNVVATPGALYRYWRQGQTGGRLALVLIAGTLPGVVGGSVIRVELLPGPHVFDLVVGAVLAPLGLWLALTRPPGAGGQDGPVRMIPVPALLVSPSAPAGWPAPGSRPGCPMS